MEGLKRLFLSFRTGPEEFPDSAKRACQNLNIF